MRLISKCQAENGKQPRKRRFGDVRTGINLLPRNIGIFVGKAAEQKSTNNFVG